MSTKYFISGLPRSGSTLLSSILNQNPQCYADLASQVNAQLDQLLYTATNGFATPPNISRTESLKHSAKSLIESYYHNINKPVIFDSNRCWSGKLPLLHDLYPNTKVICCVRNITDILNSFERIFQNNRWSPNSYLYDNASTVYHRCEGLMLWNGVIGTGLTLLKEGLHHPLADNMIFILEYDDLVDHTEEVMFSLYEFLGMDYFEHDFNNISGIRDANTLDSDLNLIGLHQLRSKVSRVKQHQYIPRDIINQYSGMEYWRYLHNVED